MHPEQLQRITLLNGAEATPGQVIVTMGKLKHLREQGLHGQILLRGLQRLCKDPNTQVDQTIVQTLIGLGLLQESGIPCDYVRDIVLSAVVKSKDVARLKLRMPYSATETNIAALGRVAKRAIEALGLQDLFLPDKELPDR